MKDEDIRTYTADELRAMKARGEDLTDWDKVDSISEDELERLIAEDPDECDLEPDWSRAVLVMPHEESVLISLDRDVVDFFRSQGDDPLARIKAVLRAYVDEQRQSGSRE